MYKNTEAVSEVVSALFAIMIVMSVVSATLIWGYPYVERIQSETSLKLVFNQLSVVTDSVQDLISEGSYSSRQHQVLIQKGSIFINSSGDRFVVFYTYKDDYNFTVSGFEDYDDIFNVTMIKSPGIFNMGNARGYRLDETRSLATPMTPAEDEVINYTNVDFTWPTEEGYLYSYILEGYSSQWSSYSTDSRKVFHNLPDNVYRFRVKNNASNYVSDVNFTIIERDNSLPLVITKTSTVGSTHFFQAPEQLYGSMRIDLFDAGNTYFFGRIYLFDIGCVECTFASTGETYKAILENNGILSISPSNRYVKREPFITSENDVFSLRIVQTRLPEAVTSSGAYATFSLDITLVENYYRELLTSVNNLKIQVQGPFQSIWLAYLERTHDFAPAGDGCTMLHSTYDGKTTLILTQSLCAMRLR